MESWIVEITFGVFSNRLTAEADRRGEGCGDEQCAFESVIRVCRLGHEASSLLYSLCVRLYRGGATQKGLPLPTLAGPRCLPFQSYSDCARSAAVSLAGCAAGVGLLDLL